jgi:hypothetical protein
MFVITIQEYTLFIMASKTFKLHVVVSFVALLFFSVSRNGCNAFSPFSSMTLINNKTSRRLLHLGMSNNKDNNKKKKKTDDESKSKSPESEPITLFELARREAEAGKRVNDRLMLPYRVGRAVNYALWTFVFLGFALNIFGYGYIRGENGQLAVGTMEERNFQLEVRKSAIEARRATEKQQKEQQQELLRQATEQNE